MPSIESNSFSDQSGQGVVRIDIKKMSKDLKQGSRLEKFPASDVYPHVSPTMQAEVDAHLEKRFSGKNKVIK